MESSDNTSANNTTSSSQSQALSKYWCFMCERDFSHPDTESAEVFCPQCNCISEKIEDSNDPRTFKPFDAQKEAPQNTQPAQNSQTNNPTNNRTQPPQPNAPIMGFNVIYHTSPMPMQPFTLHNPFAQGIPNMGMPNFGNIPPQANQNQQGVPNQNPNPPLANLFNPFLNNALNMMNQFFTGNPLQANMFGDIEGRIIEEFLRNDPNRHGPPPAPQESINKLKKSQFGETCKVKDCSVCQDDYKTGDELLTMPCDHIFHKACLEKWLGMHNSCPSCRKPLGPARDSYSENMFA